MKRQRLLLFAAGAVFALWTAWLAFEAATTTNVIIVSRPQLLIAPIVIEGEVRARGADECDVTVKHIYRGKEQLDKGDGNKPGLRTITVAGLDKARGWRGPNDYLLALQPDQDVKRERFAPVPIPISPGFRPPPGSDLSAPAIYPATESTRYQVRAILGPGEPPR